MFRRVAVVVPIRLGSSRLPRKHLLPAAGRPFLQWLVERQVTGLQAQGLESTPFVIATTAEPADDEIANWAGDLGVALYRGESQAVASRLAKAARSVGAEAMVCVDGDDIACSPRAVCAAVLLLSAGVSRVAVEGLPLGMNAAGYDLGMLEAALIATRRKIIQTGWPGIITEPAVRVTFPAREFEPGLRLTLDYAEDAAFFTALVEHFGPKFTTASDEEIIAAVIEQRLFHINSHLNDIYWKHYLGEIAAESVDE